MRADPDFEWGVTHLVLIFALMAYIAVLMVVNAYVSVVDVTVLGLVDVRRTFG